MGNLGNWLREAREAKDLSLQDVEAVTRIRTRYLEALETGDYQAMPGGPAQVRGFLRRYASFLGLSPEEAMARYGQEVGEGKEEALPATPVPPRPAPAADIEITSAPWRGWTAVVIVGLLILAGLAGVWWARGAGLLAHREPAPTVEASVAATTLAVASPAPTSTVVAVTATPTFPVAAGGGVTLTLEPSEHVWVRVTADGFAVFEGMLAPDNPQTWTAEEMVVVETGNGAGVVAVVNGQPQGTLCSRGEVCARGWGPTGEIAVPPPAVPATPQG